MVHGWEVVAFIVHCLAVTVNEQYFVETFVFKVTGNVVIA
jgi:hypothetical protein